MISSATDLLAPGSLSALVLLAFRLSGLMLIAPVFASRTVPVPVRTALIIILTWLLAPVAIGSIEGVVVISPATALSETVIGFGIGLGAAIMIAAVEMTGELLAIHMGLSGAASMDPITFQSIPVIGQFTSLFALAIMMSADAHVMMLDAVAASIRVIPVGQPVQLQAGVATLLASGSQLFLLGLRFAAPVIVAVLLANCGLAILTRAAPQLQILSVAFPVQIALGMLALVASLPLIATFFNGWGTVYDGFLGGLFTSLTTTGGR